MSIMNSDKVYKVSELIVSKKDQAGVHMLVSLDESDNFFRIDGLASTVWDMLVAGKTAPFICQTLISQYPENKEQIDQDVAGLISKLIELKILEE
jgi:hypothetical protein